MTYLWHAWRPTMAHGQRFLHCTRCGTDTYASTSALPPPWYTDLPRCWSKP